MRDTLRYAIEHRDLFQVLDCIESQTETLNEAWNKPTHETVETTLRLLIQEIESIKNDDPSLETNIAYHLGRLDGFAAAYEEVYRAERRLEAAAKTLSEHSAKSMQILQCLYDRGTMRHGELADAVGSSYSALTNSMKKILLSGAVRSARSGKNTLYYLTETGKRYCETHRREAPKGEDLKRIVEAVLEEYNRKKSAAAAENALSEQNVRVGESVFLAENEDTYQPVKINEIRSFLDRKFVHFTPTNQEKNGFGSAEAPNILYDGRIEEKLQNVRKAV